MALLECLGCLFLAFGPALNMFIFFVAKDPIRIIILISSAFFWLVALLLSSVLWFAIVPLRGTLAVALVYSVLMQEAFRYLVYFILKKAEGGLKKVTDSDSPIVNNIHVLGFVTGLGFGVMSGAFALLNVLADSVGPGTVGLKGDSDWFLFTSALTTLSFILLHPAWGVLFFDALERRSWVQLGFVPLTHLFASTITLLNTGRHYVATNVTLYALLLVISVWSFKVAGATLQGLQKAVCRRKPLKVEVPVDD